MFSKILILSLQIKIDYCQQKLNIRLELRHRLTDLEWEIHPHNLELNSVFGIGRFDRLLWGLNNRDYNDQQIIIYLMTEFPEKNICTLSSIPSAEDGDRPARPSKKYNVISYKTRRELIRRVVNQKERLLKVSQELGLKLSTSKFIVKSFKRKGIIFKKKSASSDSEDQEEILNKKQISETPEQSPLVQYIYCPYYVFIPVPYQKLVNQENTEGSDQSPIKEEGEGNFYEYAATQ